MLGFPGIAYSTQVSGDVWGVWDSTMNPIEVVGELRVPPDSSLIIGPGCYIEFQGHYMFAVDTSAVLQAEGTYEDSIIFTSNPSTAWHGIKLFRAGDGCRFSYCVFENGYAYTQNPNHQFETRGGAIYSASSDLTLRNCILRNNRAPFGEGGGIYLDNSNIEVVECEFIENYCGFGGAGLYSLYGNVSVINSLFERDTTWYPLGGETAGAIGCWDSQDVVLIGNTFTDNFSGMIGNIIRSASATILSNYFINNFALSAGGGLIIDIEDSSLVSHNLFIGNGTEFDPGGAGLTIVGSGISIINNTIVNNSSATYGGGLKCTNYDTNYASNNIIWNNAAQHGPQIFVDEGTMIFSYCDVEGGWQGVGNIDINPLFRDTANGDFHLMSTFCGDPYDSPCIDVGDPAIQDYLLDCDWGLGLQLSDMGAYGGGDSLITAIIDDLPSIPVNFMLLQNYPNPFNARTAIRFSLPKSQNVELTVYDLLGRQIEVLIDDYRDVGVHAITFDASSLSSGVYFYRLRAGYVVETRRMVLLK